MKPKQQIEALLELGIVLDSDGVTYNSIIPLIQKQPFDTKAAVYDFFTAEDAGWTTCAVAMLDATPVKLSEALLRAAGKWIE